FRRKSPDPGNQPVAGTSARDRAARPPAGSDPVASKSSGTKASRSATPARTLKSISLGGVPEAEGETAGDKPVTRPAPYTPSKKDIGQATPKRRSGGRAAEPAPANRRESYRRMRAKDREARAEARAGAMAGKQGYLPARDQGPERAL